MLTLQSQELIQCAVCDLCACITANTMLYTSFMLNLFLFNVIWNTTWAAFMKKSCLSGYSHWFTHLILEYRLEYRSHFFCKLKNIASIQSNESVKAASGYDFFSFLWVYSTLPILWLSVCDCVFSVFVYAGILELCDRQHLWNSACIRPRLQVRLYMTNKWTVYILQDLFSDSLYCVWHIKNVFENISSNQKTVFITYLFSYDSIIKRKRISEITEEYGLSGYCNKVSWWSTIVVHYICPRKLPGLQEKNVLESLHCFLCTHWISERTAPTKIAHNVQLVYPSRRWTAQKRDNLTLRVSLKSKVASSNV